MIPWRFPVGSTGKHWRNAGEVARLFHRVYSCRQRRSPRRPPIPTLSKKRAAGSGTGTYSTVKTWAEGDRISTKSTVGAARSKATVNVPQQSSVREHIQVDDISLEQTQCRHLGKTQHSSQRDNVFRQDCRAAGSHLRTFDRIGHSDRW